MQLSKEVLKIWLQLVKTQKGLSVARYGKIWLLKQIIIKRGYNPLSKLRITMCLDINKYINKHSNKECDIYIVSKYLPKYLLNYTGKKGYFTLK